MTSSSVDDTDGSLTELLDRASDTTGLPRRIFRLGVVSHQYHEKALAPQWGVVEVLVVDQEHERFVVGLEFELSQESLSMSRQIFPLHLRSCQSSPEDIRENGIKTKLS